MEGKIITLNNLIKYNENRDKVVKDKIQATIPAESGYITYVTGATGNKTINSTGFKYNKDKTAITTASNTPIIDLKNGIVNITAATANINTIYAKTGYIDSISAKQVTVDDLISTQATIKTLSLVEPDDSPIVSFAYSEEDVAYNQIREWKSVDLQFINAKTKGNMLLYGIFTAKSTKDCWFRIECNRGIKPKTINITQLSQTINTNCNAPVAYIENNYIYIGIKDAIDSKFNFTCFF